ncbi:hypothetical protein ACIP4Y_20525 [Streptomyces sp. NPDC088810]|uniref:hypothetical protein n=1 Tax=Streptomyces sp. NPDC088810 TaxID=3365904 RepID=UPI0038073B64
MVDRTFPLADVVQAHQYMEAGTSTAGSCSRPGGERRGPPVGARRDEARDTLP